MTRRRALTEREVRRAASEGRKSIDVGDAIVTPSARDVAASLGVELTRDSALGTRDSGRASRFAAPVAESRVPSAESRPSGHIVAVGADHGGVALKATIAARLAELGHAVNDLGTNGTDAVDYPDFAAAVANEVASGRARFGIMIDGAGIGSCMAANKVRGVRAAMCYDVTTATNAREHNDANLLTLGGGLIGARLALAIVETFLATPFAGGRHQPRVAKIDALDRRG
jgi:ribose 5-phosphate isomerase B